MRKLFAALAFLLSTLPALAQIPYITPSQLEPHTGFVRKSPCAAGNADNCGSNPPTWHITPDQCGTVFSTSAARNADGSNSREGVRFTLPLASEFTAMGYGEGSGPTGASGSNIRQSQCEISFVMGLPSPQNWLRLGVDGAFGSDRVTFISAGSSHDMFYGDVPIPFTPGVVTIGWNGTSWLAKSGAGSILERMAMGQMFAHGQGRLFRVTADPTWYTAGSRIGTLAYCPNKGLGTVVNNAGTFFLGLQSPTCIFLANNPGANGADWIYLRYIGSSSVTGLTQGAAYGAGTAPNGTAYAAGNYPVLLFSALTNFVTGDTINLENLRTNLGTVLNGKWIGKLLTAGVDPGCAAGTCLELHERIDEGNGIDQNVAVAPPGAFVAGDVLVPPYVFWDPTTTYLLNDTVRVGLTGYRSLQAGNLNHDVSDTAWWTPNLSIIAGSHMALAATGTATNRFTSFVTGMDTVLTTRSTVVGIGRRTVANGYEDSPTFRGVASLFNPAEKKCTMAISTDRTVTSTTFVEVQSTEARCNFAFLNHANKYGVDMGDQNSAVRWTLNVTAGNNTAASGCDFSAGFNGTTAETEVAGFVNPTGVTTGLQNVTASGAKSDLVDGSNYVTMLARAVTGGTCTVRAGSSITAFIRQ